MKTEAERNEKKKRRKKRRSASGLEGALQGVHLPGPVERKAFGDQRDLGLVGEGGWTRKLGPFNPRGQWSFKGRLTEKGKKVYPDGGLLNGQGREGKWVFHVAPLTAGGGIGDKEHIREWSAGEDRKKSDDRVMTIGGEG